MQKWGILVIPLVSWVVTASAANAENPISFMQAMEIIFANNRGLKATATDYEAAEAGVRQAGALSNPGIDVSLDNFGKNEIEASVQYTFELGSKRFLRKLAAQKELDEIGNARKLTRLELEAEMVRRFILIPVITEKLEVLDSIVATAAITKEQIRKRVEAGAARKTDLIRAEIELEQHALMRSELNRELVQARKKFAVLGGDQQLTLDNVTGTLDESVVPSLDDLNSALTNSPQISAQNIEKAKLEIQKKQLETEAIPDLDVSAGVLRNNIDNEFSPLVGLSMNIPIFNANKGALNQTKLRQQALDERKGNQLRILSAEVQDLYSRLLEIDNKIETLRTGTIPKAESVYSILQDYYASGSVGYIDLTAAQTEMLRLRMDLIDIEAERAMVLVDLMQVTSLHIKIVK